MSQQHHRPAGARGAAAQLSSSGRHFPLIDVRSWGKCKVPSPFAEYDSPSSSSSDSGSDDSDADEDMMPGHSQEEAINLATGSGEETDSDLPSFSSGTDTDNDDVYA